MQSTSETFRFHQCDNTLYLQWFRQITFSRWWIRAFVLLGGYITAGIPNGPPGVVPREVLKAGGLDWCKSGRSRRKILNASTSLSCGRYGEISLFLRFSKQQTEIFEMLAGNFWHNKITFSASGSNCSNSRSCDNPWCATLDGCGEGDNRCGSNIDTWKLQCLLLAKHTLGLYGFALVLFWDSIDSHSSSTFWSLLAIAIALTHLRVADFFSLI